MGEPFYAGNSGQDKVNYSWNIDADGLSGEIYDYKYYRPLAEYQVIFWNIGGESRKQTDSIGFYVNKLLAELQEINPVKTVEILRTVKMQVRELYEIPDDGKILSELNVNNILKSDTVRHIDSKYLYNTKQYVDTVFDTVREPKN